MIWLRANWRIIAAICLVSGAFLAGWVAKGWKDDSIKLAIEQATAQSRDASATAAAAAIAKIQISNTTIQGKVIERIRTETVYAECRHSPDTYNLILEAFK